MINKTSFEKHVLEKKINKVNWEVKYAISRFTVNIDFIVFSVERTLSAITKRSKTLMIILTARSTRLVADM